MVNSHFIKFLLGKESFYKGFSNDSYDCLKFHIFAWLGLNPDYAPDTKHVFTLHRTLFPLAKKQAECNSTSVATVVAPY